LVAAVDADVTVAPRFESLSGAAGRGVDIDPMVVDGQDGDPPDPRDFIPEYRRRARAA